MIDTNIIGGILFGIVLTIVIGGTAIQEAKNRRKQKSPDEED